MLSFTMSFADVPDLWFLDVGDMTCDGRFELTFVTSLLLWGADGYLEVGAWCLAC